MFVFLLAEVGISLHPSPPLNRLLVFWESRQFLIWMSAALILLGMISLTSDRAQNDRPKTAWLNCHSRVLPRHCGDVLKKETLFSMMLSMTIHKQIICYWSFWLQLFFFSPQLRNEVLPLQLSAVQRLENFSLLEDKSRVQNLSTETLSRQSVKQKLLVSMWTVDRCLFLDGFFLT